MESSVLIAASGTCSCGKQALVAQVCTCALLCLTLCNHVDCCPPGSSAHGIFQARILEWVAISCSRGSSQPRDRTPISDGSCTGRQVLHHWGTWEAPLFHVPCTSSSLAEFSSEIADTFHMPVPLPHREPCELFFLHNQCDPHGTCCIYKLPSPLDI